MSMSIVSLIKPRVTHVITSREIPRQTNVRTGISTLATSLPDEKKIKPGFFTEFLKWSRQSKLGEVLFKTIGLYIQLINHMAHSFSIDLGIDKLVEDELNKYLFRTDLTDPIPSNIDLDSLIKLEKNGEPTLYGHFYESKNSKLLAIYLHGFGSNIFEDIPNCLRIQKELGVNVLCVDYRGYGLSQGTPTIDGVTNDVIRMYNYATQVKGYDGKNIIFVGISLGSPIALEAYSVLKKQNKPLGGMALLYTFSSVQDITRWRFPEVPVYLLPDDKFNARKLVKSVTVPLHVAWGDRDNDTPNKQSELVYRNAPGPHKTKFILSEIGHCNLGTSEHPSVADYYSSVREWLKKYFIFEDMSF
jgi:hypothetical protein